MRRSILYLALQLLFPVLLNAQTGLRLDFDDGLLQEGWENTGAYALTVRDSLLEMDIQKSLWEGLLYNFPTMDLSGHPVLSMDLRASDDCSVMIWIYDSAGLRNPVSCYVPAVDSMASYLFDFTGMLESYHWDNRYVGEVDYTKITTILFNVNPGGSYSGTLEVDNLALGDSALAPSFTPGTGPYLDSVQIVIHPDSIAKLDLDPTEAEDVYGDFIDNSGHVYDHIQLHYRGASNLLGLIGSGRPQRNWKVKVDSDDMYRGRREWNLNFSMHARQELAYHLFARAGVPCISTRHVNLLLNGESHGLYLEYEDPDNKPWLEDTYGDDAGDLFKAALDIPGELSYFAELTYLGPESADYFNHYRKKTNHKVAPEDYTSVRDLVIHINFTPNEVFMDSLERHFDTEGFISYLVISNFISNWDGYPHRGKNYWLYQDPSRENIFSFIPWDLDATFGIQTHDWNQMGTRADLFYQFDRTVWAGHNTAEDADRPLVRRMMRFAQYRNAYINRYKEALSTLLVKEKLFADLDSLDGLVRQNSRSYEYQIFHNSITTTKVFVHQRTAYTGAVLDTLTLMDTVEVTHPVDPYPQLTYEPETTGPVGDMLLGNPWPNPTEGRFAVPVWVHSTGPVHLALYDMQGRMVELIYEGELDPGSHLLQAHPVNVAPGIYYLGMVSSSGRAHRRIMIHGGH